MKKQVRRFTLVELFIVLVGVVVAFGLMLLPALIRIREHERVINCTANLSQIGKAFFQYAMSYDDWYPTTQTTSKPKPKWLAADSYKALDTLRSQDLLTDPKGYLCPSASGPKQADPNKELKKDNVSYNWVDALMGGNATISPVCADGSDNHSSTGRFVRGDGSVGVANSSGSGTSNGWWKITSDLKVESTPNTPAWSYKQDKAL